MKKDIRTSKFLWCVVILAGIAVLTLWVFPPLVRIYNQKEQSAHSKPLSGAKSVPSAISPSEIEQLLKTTNHAANARDAEGFRQTFWDDARVGFLKSGIKSEITVPQYLAQVESKWQAVQSYSRQDIIQQMKVNDDQATVLIEAEERGRRPDGSRIRMMATERRVLEKRSGQVKTKYKEIDLDSVRLEVEAENGPEEGPDQHHEE